VTIGNQAAQQIADETCQAAMADVRNLEALHLPR
jgi:hypothetical protein